MFKKLGRFIKRHSHQIAAVLALLGIGATSYTSAKAGAKISKKIENAEKEKSEPLTFKEKVVIAAPELVVPAVVATATAGAVVTGAIASEKMIVGAGAVIAGTAKKFSEYQEAVKAINPEVAEQAKEMTAKDRVVDYIKKHGTSYDDNHVLYYDGYTRQTFEGPANLPLKAECRFNNMMDRKGYVTYNEYCTLLGEKDDFIGGNLYGWGKKSFVYNEDDHPDLVMDDQTYIMIFEEICVLDDGLEYHVLEPSVYPDEDFLSDIKDKSCPFDVR